VKVVQIGKQGGRITMSQLENAVLKETLKFREMLPTLMVSHAGKWVLFKDERVVGAHATEMEAFEAGVSAFGSEGGFVVALVAKTKPTPINAAAAFGLAQGYFNQYQ
jgi:hypothetical protein